MITMQVHRLAAALGGKTAVDPTLTFRNAVAAPDAQGWIYTQIRGDKR